MVARTRRNPAFQEVGLADATGTLLSPTSTRKGRPQSVRFRSRDEVHLVERYEDVLVDEKQETIRLRTTQYISLESPLPSSWSSRMMYRFGALLVVFAALVPLLHATEVFGNSASIPLRGVRGAVIPEQPWLRSPDGLEKREDSPTTVCFRWAQQSALVNGTLYLYGGQAILQGGQTQNTAQNTWNNDFLTIDLTQTWQAGSPAMKGLPQPDGPPAVALGYLWNSYDSLFLYGGEFSWKPPVEPVPLATWEYHIKSGTWIEYSNPTTSAGENAPDSGIPVQRAAEGAGANVPSLGRGFYFGGHQDLYTTPGWDISIARVYLQSLLEYTFPGYTNDDVTSLKTSVAGSDGVYRNITEGKLQTDAGFTDRADGLLIYVPGFGDEGILLALAGGTNVTFTQMNNIDIFDIATSTWYKQATSGTYPKMRVNPCAVIAAAQDGSSYNIYMFGGQDLLPYGSQKQKQDMWILTLPSFTWIQVDQSGQSVPYGRSGATCNIWDAQMVMVGGYVGKEPLTCESPGVYVFDLSNLQWVQQFTALSASSQGLSQKQNPLNQQPNQRFNDKSPGGLEGSYGYEVPDAVISVIGGGKTGGATLTTPVVTATGGPLKTGSPVTYTVTQSNGVVTTETAGPGRGTVITTGSSGPNIAAIVVGTVCGVLFIVICYLLFCLYLYRKQLALYKRHVEMSQRQARGEKPPAIPGLWHDDSDATSTTRRVDDNGMLIAGVGSSKAGSGSHAGSGGQTSGTTHAGGYQSARRDSGEQSSTEDLLAGQEPTFVGVMLHPRRSLRVTNRD